MRSALPFMMFIALSGCGVHTEASNHTEANNANPRYVMYRNSIVMAGRVHIATFDYPDTDADFNRDECQATADLITKEGHTGNRFWCEQAT